ncbi:glutaminase A [Tessaracoccus rhinocerotis]|uniref:Glutaminase n=1 Tax=Tessaracoccus rhinocerotis TaxID=1689449 RepID=A0A553JW99_9ACTN|nr:glutaminase A [Tessaracoccus rhinocerotis]TRY16703.1 glutaminase A [Tessaracoccus rhinocerotis]
MDSHALGQRLDRIVKQVRELDDGDRHPIEVNRGVDPELTALALVDVGGEQVSAGDADFAFPIQSMSKAFAYGLAIDTVGLDEVFRHVDVEPSGDAFNRISLAEGDRPDNPMINAGALTVHALLPGGNCTERFQAVHELLSHMAGRELSVNEELFEEELASADRNLGIAHLLKALGVLDADPHDVVEGYTRQCAIEATTVDFARMAATLAHDGVVPGTDERSLTSRAARQVLSVMMTCGMYDDAGEWVTAVGLPGKSGISGGIIAAVPGTCGIAAYSPRLDQHGSSVRGIRALELLSGGLGLHLLRPGLAQL